MSPAALRRAFFAAVRSQPRVTYIGPFGGAAALDGAAAATHVFVQRSLLFQFPDVVTVRFSPFPIPMNKSTSNSSGLIDANSSAKGSTLAIHSTSVFGEGDLGVNAARVEAWLEATQLEALSGA